MGTLQSPHLVLKLLREELGKHLDVDGVIASFGQMEAARKREARHPFALPAHLRAMILAMLSANRPWRRIAERLTQIDAAFEGYDPDSLLACSPDGYIIDIPRRYLIEIYEAWIRLDCTPAVALYGRETMTKSTPVESIEVTKLIECADGDVADDYFLGSWVKFALPRAFELEPEILPRWLGILERLTDDVDSAAREVGRLGRARSRRLARAAREALPAHPDHLLQLRVGLRAGGLRRQGDGPIAKFEGNPVHPGSRGRTCAKGPATINQIHDPERILVPLKRKGPRGSGEFEEVSWEAALDDIGTRIRRAIAEGRNEEVMYHVGRPGEDHFVLRMLQAWGVDGHNSHTNVCSASARLGYALWMGADRPSPDHSQTEFMLLLSSHLETGHYFNPARAADRRGQGARGAPRRDRHAPEQHREPRAPVDRALAGDGGGAPSRRGVRAPAARRDRPRLRAALGQLARVP